MSDTDTPPRLLHFEVSHYNEKVRWALDFKRWPHVRETLTPGLHVPRVRWLTGQQRVPVLVLDGKAIWSSSTILEEIERRRPEPRLYPERPEDRARALEVQTYFDDVVAPEVRRIFWSTYFPQPALAARMATGARGGAVETTLRLLFPVLRPVFGSRMGVNEREVTAALERLPSHFEWLERRIGPSGYLVGDAFGLADLCAAAVMTAIVRPPEFPYPLPEPRPEALVALREKYVERPGGRWVQDIYRKHRGTSAEIAA